MAHIKRFLENNNSDIKFTIDEILLELVEENKFEISANWHNQGGSFMIRIGKRKAFKIDPLLEETVVRLYNYMMPDDDWDVTSYIRSKLTGNMKNYQFFVIDDAMKFDYFGEIINMDKTDTFNKFELINRIVLNFKRK